MMIIDSYRFGAGGGSNIIEFKNGVTVDARKYFIDIPDFDLSGSGDYTFLAWMIIPAGERCVPYYQVPSFTSGTGRVSVTSIALEVAGVNYGANGNDVDSTPTAVVIRKDSGTTGVFYLKAGVFYSTTGLSVPDVGAYTINTIGSVPFTNLTQTTDECEIIAIQQLNSAMSDSDIETMLLDYSIMTTSDVDWLPYLELTGSSDNGAYPAIMTSDTATSPYVLTYSFAKTNFGSSSFSIFGNNFNTYCAFQATSSGPSAGGWLKMDMGSGNSQAIDAIYFRSLTTQGLNSFTVSGSNDDSTYTDLITDNGVNTNTTLQKFTWTNATTYRYYKLTCNSGYNSGQFSIQELYFIDRSKQWQTDGGYARDLSNTFPS